METALLNNNSRHKQLKRKFYQTTLVDINNQERYTTLVDKICHGDSFIKPQLSTEKRLIFRTALVDINSQVKYTTLVDKSVLEKALLNHTFVDIYVMLN